jgi:hypothetical protein
MSDHIQDAHCRDLAVCSAITVLSWPFLARIVYLKALPTILSWLIISAIH